MSALVADGSGRGSIAIGHKATVRSESAAIAIGILSRVTAAGEDGGVAIGNSAAVVAGASVAVGPLAGAIGTRAVAVGPAAAASGGDAIAIGRASATAEAAIAVGGMGAAASAYGATTIGAGAASVGERTVALGALSSASAFGAIAIGAGAVAANPEIAVLAARDMEIARSDAAITGQIPIGGMYGNDLETGIILHSSDGSSWRLSVAPSGVLQVDGYSTPTPPPFDWEEGAAGEFTALTASDDGTILYAIAADGVYRSSDRGATFTRVYAANGLTAIAASRDGQYAITARYDAYPVCTSNGGATWVTIGDAGWPDWNAVDVSDDGQVLVASYNESSSGTFYMSSDGGASFVEATIGGDNLSAVASVAVSGDGVTIMAIGALWAGSTDDGFIPNVQTSTDGGETWLPLLVEFDAIDSMAEIRQPHLSSDGSHMVVFVGATAWVSHDSGENFTAITGLNGLTAVSDDAATWLATNPLRLSEDGADSFSYLYPTPTTPITAVATAGDSSLQYLNADGRIYRSPS